MPAQPGPSNAALGSAAAFPVVFERVLTFAGAGVQTSREIHGEGLAGLNVYVQHTTGAGLVTVTVQFAQGIAIGGGTNWENLAPAFPILLGTPSVNNFHLGSRRYRLSVESTGVATVSYRLVGAFT